MTCDYCGADAPDRYGRCTICLGVCIPMPEFVLFMGQRWELEGTGGGCDAYIYRRGNREWLITTTDEPAAPLIGERASLSLFKNGAYVATRHVTFNATVTA